MKIDVVSEAIGGIGKVVDNLVTSKAEKAAILAEAQAAAAKIQLGLVQEQSKVIIEEARGQSWLQRNWRPLLMAVFTAIIANNYVLAPYIELFVPGRSVVLELPDRLWQLLLLGVGGYIGARSLFDKGGLKDIADALKSKRERRREEG